MDNTMHSPVDPVLKTILGEKIKRAVDYVKNKYVLLNLSDALILAKLSKDASERILLSVEEKNVLKSNIPCRKLNDNYRLRQYIFKQVLEDIY